MTTARPRPLISRALAPLVVALALVGGATALGAQQREVFITTARAPRAMNDSTERVVRRLRARVDSLTRTYNDNEELSADERQRVAEELERTMQEMARTLAGNPVRRTQTGTFRVQVAPMDDARAREELARTMMVRSGGVRSPRGWLGIVVSGAASEPWVERGELMIRYATHPEIVTVEPSSPAERAGLTPGDTLFAYNGRDVRDTDISITSLLVPNARVLVRVGRDGHVRDVPVTIADAPSRIQIRRDEMRSSMSIMRAPLAIAQGPRFPTTALAPPSAGSMPPRRPNAVPAPTPPPAPAPVGGLAGAQMSSLTAEWARLVGVAHGVLVMRAPVGSLAAESGLQDADVIVRAGGRDVRTFGELRDIVALAVSNGDRMVPVSFVRERKTRSGALRW